MPDELRYRTTETLLARHFDYRERLRVEPAAGNRAAQLRADAVGRASAWEQGLLLAAAERWQAFQESQTLSVTTRFNAESPVQRDWTLPVPSTETLEWQGETARRERWLLGVGGVALGLLLMMGAIWLPRRGGGKATYGRKLNS